MAAFQDVLLDYHPAVKILLLQQLDNLWEVYNTLSQRHKRSVADGRVEVEASMPSLSQFCVANVLQVDTPRARQVASEKFDRIASSVNVVARVQAQTQFLWRKEREKLVHFFRRFHVRAHVMVEGDREAPARFAAGIVCSLSQNVFFTPIFAVT